MQHTIVTDVSNIVILVLVPRMNSYQQAVIRLKLHTRSLCDGLEVFVASAAE